MGGCSASDLSSKNAPGIRLEDGPSLWGPDTHVGGLDGPPVPGFGPFAVAIWRVSQMKGLSLC